MAEPSYVTSIAANIERGRCLISAVLSLYGMRNCKNLQIKLPEDAEYSSPPESSCARGLLPDIARQQLHSSWWTLICWLFCFFRMGNEGRGSHLFLSALSALQLQCRCVRCWRHHGFFLCWHSSIVQLHGLQWFAGWPQRSVLYMSPARRCLVMKVF